MVLDCRVPGFRNMALVFCLGFRVLGLGLGLGLGLEMMKVNRVVVWEWVQDLTFCLRCAGKCGDFVVLCLVSCFIPFS